MRRAHVHHVPVLDGEELVGILADQDVFAGLAGQAPAGPHHGEVTVRDFMTAHPLTITTAEEAALAAAVLLAHHVGSLPVMSRDRLVGIITARDYLTYCLGRTAAAAGAQADRRRPHPGRSAVVQDAGPDLDHAPATEVSEASLPACDIGAAGSARPPQMTRRLPT
jgi:CBS-domain-containing membrane protein